MKNKKMLYIILILVSIGLFALSITVLDSTKFIAPVIIVLSIYLFLGSLMKLCRTNDKLKDSVIFAIDLLFWLP